MPWLDEHELIARHFRSLATDPAARSLLDDAAVLMPPPGRDLVLTKDGIAEGVHFPVGETGGAVAAKALRVNLSDLAAMGADPLGYLLLLALPEGWTEAWVADLAHGLAADQVTYAIPLLGGDTIRAAGLTVSVTAIGAVPRGSAVARRGARPGDVVYVSGTIGDGALGLLVATNAEGATATLPAGQREHLLSRYRIPQPRVALASALRDHARAALDISDGLAGDLDKLCRASGVTARIECGSLPLSEAARAAVDADPTMLDLCLTGGDDYEILSAVPPGATEAFEAAAAAAGVAVAAIGAIAEGAAPAAFLGPDGAPHMLARRSYSHTG